MVTRHAMEDTLNYKLKMCGRLCKVHWHPEPLELALVGNEGHVIRRDVFKWGIVEAAFKSSMLTQLAHLSCI